MLHASASIGIHDGVRKAFPESLAKLRERTLIRVLVVALAAISYYFAVSSEFSLVALLLAAYGGVAQIFPLMFAAFYWPRANGQGALAGLVAGLVVNTIFLNRPDLSPIPGMHEGIYGLVANVLVFVTVTFATPPPPVKEVKPFMEA